MKYLKLFENIQSHKNISKLAELILTAIANRTILYCKWVDYGDDYINNTNLLLSCILPIIVSEIDVKGKGFDTEFRKFIKDKKTWFRVNVDKKTDNINGQYLPSRENIDKRRIEIGLFYDVDNLNDYFNELDENLSNITYHNLIKFLSQRKNTLEHELQHAYDDWRSKGNAIKHVINSDQYKEYAKTPHEISAFYTNTVSKILAYNYKSNNSDWSSSNFSHTWDNVISEFMKIFPNWEGQNENTKKRLQKRLYQEWYKKFGIKEAKPIDITDKLKKLQKDLRNEYSEDIILHYNHDQNSIKIDALKVDTIKLEKEIYKKIIKIADQYKKTIVVNLYKNYTTNYLIKAREYLKRFGFKKNIEPKYDYRFMEDYIRYTKRK